ncbi:MAG: hypothetical protein HY791_24845 [Deltaproteobacteria bacterium]|nr:hypothetical protein [Deltaproteobacteria bacterium]
MKGLWDNIGLIVGVLYLILQILPYLKKKRDEAAEYAASEPFDADSGQTQQATINPPQAAEAPSFDDEVFGLEARVNGLAQSLGNRPGPAAVLGKVIESRIRPQLIGARELLRLAVDDPGLLYDAHQTLEDIGLRIAVIETMAKWRSDPKLGGFLADADAIAHALLVPLTEHAQAGAIEFPTQRPLCVPADPEGEAIWIGLLEDYPLIFVPDDFGDDLYRWPSIAHEIGHLIWHRVPGYGAEVMKKLDLEGSTRLAIQGRSFDVKPAYRAWIQELVADAFALLILGPAGLRGLIHSFRNPTQPRATRVAAIYRDGTFEEHPPAELRVLLGAALLTEIGFDVEAKVLVAEWTREHASTEGILVPLPQSRAVISVPTEVWLEVGRPIMLEWYALSYSSLGGHEIRSVHGVEMTPGMWKKVSQRAADLVSGTSFNDDPKIVVAAAIEARARSPGAKLRLERAVREAILGLDAKEKRVADRNYARTGRTTQSQLLRDAIVLRELLSRPRAQVGQRARRGRASAL